MLRAIFEENFRRIPYKSPTDMGVNMAGNCITDDEVVRQAACDEIIRRYYNAFCGQRQGFTRRKWSISWNC